MNFRKSQTATEYIVIVAVVIVIALVVVQIMGGFPEIGGSTSNKMSDFKLATGSQIAVSNYYFGNGYVIVTLKNNYYKTLNVQNITIAGILCDINNCKIAGTSKAAFILSLTAGQRKTINCTDLSFKNTSNFATPTFTATYVNPATSAN